VRVNLKSGSGRNRATIVGEFLEQVSEKIVPRWNRNVA